ncbi:hypothetical protein C8R44DRAFT_876718 [Mycena epipterygia]|nr:hypothetical protein C8R44DRAFT_876718 [Mycena epipterygia]
MPPGMKTPELTRSIYQFPGSMSESGTVGQEFHNHVIAPQPAFNAAVNPVWNAEVYREQPYLPCPECLFFECPNATGDYGCPYSTVHDVPDRYDPTYCGVIVAPSFDGLPSGRYGYEHLPMSANPRGWTFENTGCRLYNLGLKGLAPVGAEGAEHVVRGDGESAV